MNHWRSNLSPLASEPFTSTGPRPGWYLSRGNGVFVPLVAADELPSHINLKGVPRRMNRSDIARQGLNRSEFLGEFIGTGKTFGLTEDSALKHPPGRVDALSNEFNRYHTQAIGPEGRLLARSAPNPAGSALFAKHDFALERLLPPSGREPDYNRKRYCTHWIKYGECNYVQQGCRYKHEMPDRETLLKIGFRGVPKWWSEERARVRPKAADLPIQPADRIADMATLDDSTGSEAEGSPRLPFGNPDGGRFQKIQLPGAMNIVNHKTPPANIPTLNLNDNYDPRGGPRGGNKSHRHASRGSRTQRRKPKEDISWITNSKGTQNYQQWASKNDFARGDVGICAKTSPLTTSEDSLTDSRDLIDLDSPVLEKSQLLGTTPPNTPALLGREVECELSSDESCKGQENTYVLVSPGKSDDENIGSGIENMGQPSVEEARTRSSEGCDANGDVIETVHDEGASPKSPL